MHISVDYTSTGPKRDNAAERLDGLNDFEVYVVGLRDDGGSEDLQVG